MSRTVRLASEVYSLTVLVHSTCEYRNGCEWREEKALEAVAGVQARRRSSS